MKKDFFVALENMNDEWIQEAEENNVRAFFRRQRAMRRALLSVTACALLCLCFVPLLFHLIQPPETNDGADDATAGDRHGYSFSTKMTEEGNLVWLAPDAGADSAERLTEWRGLSVSASLYDALETFDRQAQYCLAVKPTGAGECAALADVLSAAGAQDIREEQGEIRCVLPGTALYALAGQNPDAVFYLAVLP